MGVLDTILAYKKQKDAEANADLQAIPQAAMLYQQGQQQRFDNQIKMLTTQASLAKSGYTVGKNGQLVRDQSIAQMNPVFTIDDQGNLVQSGNVPKGGRVMQLPQSVEQIREKSMASKESEASFLKEPEIQDIRNISDSFNLLKEVKNNLDELGIKDPRKYGNIETENVDSNFGPISIPARFNLAGQYAKDPKYTATKNKLERGFQAFRKVVTGAQASNVELQNLRPLIASFKDRPEVFFENLDSIINENKRMLSTRFDLYDAVGRDTKKLRDLYKDDLASEQASPSVYSLKVGGSFNGSKIKSVKKIG